MYSRYPTISIPSFSLLCQTLLVVLSFTSVVSANTPIPAADVALDLTENAGIRIAYASRPLWHFGKAMSKKPCYPTFALVNGAQHGVNPSNYPNAGDGCVDPGPGGMGANPFPTYYTTTQCNENEIRVAYNLYFQKDGWSNVIVAKGHMHDWERIIAIWTRNTTTNTWKRTTLLRSYHTGYMKENWASIQNTFDESDSTVQNAKDRDHPKIYIGWGKHAMFSTRNTGFNDPLSQGCTREFRSNDWWYLPKVEDLIPAGVNSTAGAEIASFKWGSADSTPPIVESKVCMAKEGGYTSC